MAATIHVNGSLPTPSEVYAPYGVAVTLVNATLTGVTTQTWEVRVPEYEDGTLPDFAVAFAGWTWNAVTRTLSLVQAGSYPSISFTPDVPGTYSIRLTATVAGVPAESRAVVRVRGAQSGEAEPGHSEEVESGPGGWMKLVNRRMRLTDIRRGRVRVYNNSGGSIAGGKVGKFTGAVDFRTIFGNAVPGGSVTRAEKILTIAQASSNDADALTAAYCVVPATIANGAAGDVIVWGLHTGSFGGFADQQIAYLNATGDIVAAPAGTYSVSIGVVVDNAGAGALFVRGIGGGQGGAAPAQFLTLATDANLSNERVFTPAPGVLQGTDGGAGGAYTLTIADQGVARAKLANAAGVSVLGNAGASPGTVTDLVATDDGDYLRRVGGALAWGDILDEHLPGTIARRGEDTASWPLGQVRYFLVDNEAGNDANLGYVDAAPGATINPAGLAIKTIERLLAIIPRSGAGRTYAALLKGRSAGQYVDALGSPATFHARGFFGYHRQVIRGSSDLTNSAADKLKCGGRTAPGFSAGGYNITTATYTITAITNAQPMQVTTSAAHGLTTGDEVTIGGVLGLLAANGEYKLTVVDATRFTLNNTAAVPGEAYTSGGTVTVYRCTLAGGGAPGFPAENSSVGYRIRFDETTATVALRNTCYEIFALGNSTITPGRAFLANPTASDVAYVEEAGAAFTSVQVNTYGGLSVTGLNSAGEFYLQGVEGIPSAASLSHGSLVASFCQSGGTFGALGRFGQGSLVNLYFDESDVSVTNGGLRAREYTTRYMGAVNMFRAMAFGTSAPNIHSDIGKLTSFHTCRSNRGLDIVHSGTGAGGISFGTYFSSIIGKNGSSSSRRIRLGGSAHNGSINLVFSAVSVRGVFFDGVVDIGVRIQGAGVAVAIDDCVGVSSGAVPGVSVVNGARGCYAAIGTLQPCSVVGAAGAVAMANGKSVATWADLVGRIVEDGAQNRVVGLGAGDVENPVTRTTDPAAPLTGDMWMRSDIYALSLEDAEGDVRRAWFTKQGPLTADWPLDQVRYFLVSYANGNDANVGYIDAAPGATFVPATLRALAVKTWGALRSKIPALGYDRSFVVLIEGDKNGQVTYYKPDGTTIDDLYLTNLEGYSGAIARASDFTNDANDKVDLCCRVFHAGPGVGGVFTVQSVSGNTITISGGTLTTGAALAGKKVQFTGNVTGALRALSYTVQRVISPTSFVVAYALTMPAAGDTFTIRAPSVVFSSWVPNSSSRVCNDNGRSLQTCGIRFQWSGTPAGGQFTTSLLLNAWDGDALVFVEFAGSVGLEAGRDVSLSQYRDEAGVLIGAYGTITVEGGFTCFRGSSFFFIVVKGSAFFAEIDAMRPLGAAFHGGLVCSGLGALPVETSGRAAIGTSTSGWAPTYVNGALQAQAAAIVIGGAVIIANAPAPGAIQLTGVCDVRIDGVIDGGNNAGHGLVLTEAEGSRVVIEGTNTVTGSSGDILLAGGVTRSWADVAADGFVDAAGNIILSTGGGGPLMKITPNTLVNAQPLASDPASPLAGDLWLKADAAGLYLVGRNAGVTHNSLIPNVGPGAATYSGGIASLTLDAKGRVTALTTGGGSGGFVAATRSIFAGAGLTGGGDLSADRTIAMPNVGPGAGVHGGSGIAALTLDAQGRVTAVTPGGALPISLAAGQVAYGSALNTIGGDTGFTFDSANDTLRIHGGVAGPGSANAWRLKLYDSGVLASSYGIGIEGSNMWLHTYGGFRGYRGGVLFLDLQGTGGGKVTFDGGNFRVDTNNVNRYLNYQAGALTVAIEDTSFRSEIVANPSGGFLQFTNASQPNPRYQLAGDSFGLGLPGIKFGPGSAGLASGVGYVSAALLLGMWAGGAQRAYITNLGHFLIGRTTDEALPMLQVQGPGWFESASLNTLITLRRTGAPNGSYNFHGIEFRTKPTGAEVTVGHIGGNVLVASGGGTEVTKAFLEARADFFNFAAKNGTQTTSITFSASDPVDEQRAGTIWIGNRVGGDLADQAKTSGVHVYGLDGALAIKGAGLFETDSLTLPEALTLRAGRFDAAFGFHGIDFQIRPSFAPSNTVAGSLGVSATVSGTTVIKSWIEARSTGLNVMGPGGTTTGWLALNPGDPADFPLSETIYIGARSSGPPTTWAVAGVFVYSDGLALRTRGGGYFETQAGTLANQLTLNANNPSNGQLTGIEFRVKSTSNDFSGGTIGTRSLVSGPSITDRWIEHRSKRHVFQTLNANTARTIIEPGESGFVVSAKRATELMGPPGADFQQVWLMSPTNTVADVNLAQIHRDSFMTDAVFVIEAVYMHFGGGSYKHAIRDEQLWKSSGGVVAGAFDNRRANMPERYGASASFINITMTAPSPGMTVRITPTIDSGAQAPNGRMFVRVYAHSWP